MCRLAYYTPRAHKMPEKTIKEHYDSLMKSMGGHGNGIATIDPSGKVRHYKRSVKLSTRRCANLTVKALSLGLYVMFHTRWVSVGRQCSAQCHPHRVVGNGFRGVVSHNGTWGLGATLARYFGRPDEISDSQVYARLLAEFGREEMQVRRLYPDSGVWLIGGQTPDGPTLTAEKVSGMGDLRYCPELGIWASSFPWSAKTMEHYEVAAGLHDVTAEEDPEKAYSIWSHSETDWKYYSDGQTYYCAGHKARKRHRKSSKTGKPIGGPKSNNIRGGKVIYI